MMGADGSDSVLGNVDCYSYRITQLFSYVGVEVLYCEMWYRYCRGSLIGILSGLKGLGHDKDTGLF
jgi:hypothetical protein